MPAKLLMLKTLVERSGIADEIITAKNTEEAKRLIDKQQFAYAFIDYEMPSENGPAVIRYLREKQVSCLIALETSADSQEYETNAREAGATEFVCTSYPSDQVEAEIVGILEKWKKERN